MTILIILIILKLYWFQPLKNKMTVLQILHIKLFRVRIIFYLTIVLTLYFNRYQRPECQQLLQIYLLKLQEHQ